MSKDATETARPPGVVGHDGNTTPSAKTATEIQPKKPQGLRKNGKQWHDPSTRRPFRPGSSTNPSLRANAFARRQVQRTATEAAKAIESEMKAEKEAERKEHVDRILNRRKEKEEKERQAIIEAKMSVKRRERLKRKQKRNKLLNS